MIREAIAATPGTIGFRTRTTLDESPEMRDKTRLAVAWAKDGDQDAVRYLYVSYSHNIYGCVRSIVRDDCEAEDVTQHVFAKLMTSIVKYDDRGLLFFAWLMRLARNVAIDHLRANRRTPTEIMVDPDLTSGAEMGLSPQGPVLPVGRGLCLRARGLRSQFSSQRSTPTRQGR